MNNNNGLIEFGGDIVVTNTIHDDYDISTIRLILDNIKKYLKDVGPKKDYLLIINQGTMGEINYIEISQDVPTIVKRYPVHAKIDIKKNIWFIDDGVAKTLLYPSDY